MGRILFSKKVVIEKTSDHIICEPDACGATAYRAPIELTVEDLQDKVGDAVGRITKAFDRYAEDRQHAAATMGSFIGHKLIRVRLWDPTIEWIEFEYAT